MPVSPAPPPADRVRVVVYMSAEQAQALRALARRHGHPVASEVREAVRAHLDREQS